MNDPKYTAGWLKEKVFTLLDSDGSTDLQEITLLLIIIRDFDDSLGELYKENIYASEKLISAEIMLKRVLGAEKTTRSREELLHFAVGDLSTLADLDFVLND